MKYCKQTEIYYVKLFDKMNGEVVTTSLVTFKVEKYPDKRKKQTTEGSSKQIVLVQSENHKCQ